MVILFISHPIFEQFYMVVGYCLSSMQKETGLSSYIAEKLKNLYLTAKHEKCMLPIYNIL